MHVLFWYWREGGEIGYAYFRSLKVMSETSKKMTTLLLLIITVVGALCYLVRYGSERNAQRIAAINKGSKHTKGVIKRIFHYKGQTVTVYYQVNNVNYEYVGVWDNNPKHLGVDDTIDCRYAVSDPNMVITELENGY